MNGSPAAGQANADMPKDAVRLIARVPAGQLFEPLAALVQGGCKPW